MSGEKHAREREQPGQRPWGRECWCVPITVRRLWWLEHRGEKEGEAWRGGQRDGQGGGRSFTVTFTLGKMTECGRVGLSSYKTGFLG
jgi:hypothetical protein